MSEKKRKKKDGEDKNKKNQRMREAENVSRKTDREPGKRDLKSSK